MNMFLQKPVHIRHCKQIVSAVWSDLLYLFLKSVGLAKGVAKLSISSKVHSELELKTAASRKAYTEKSGFRFLKEKKGHETHA